MHIFETFSDKLTLSLHKNVAFWLGSSLYRYLKTCTIIIYYENWKFRTWKCKGSNFHPNHATVSNWAWRYNILFCQSFIFWPLSPKCTFVHEIEINNINRHTFSGKKGLQGQSFTNQGLFCFLNPQFIGFFSPSSTLTALCKEIFRKKPMMTMMHF